jgi:hypothetical protein
VVYRVAVVATLNDGRGSVGLVDPDGKMIPLFFSRETHPFETPQASANPLAFTRKLNGLGQAVSSGRQWCGVGIVPNCPKFVPRLG